MDTPEAARLKLGASQAAFAQPGLGFHDPEPSMLHGNPVTGLLIATSCGLSPTSTRADTFPDLAAAGPLRL